MTRFLEKYPWITDAVAVGCLIVAMFGLAAVFLFADTHREMKLHKPSAAQVEQVRRKAHEAAPEPVKIFVGPGKDVSVTVPHVARENLQEIVVSFLANEAQKSNFNRVFGQATELTLTLTTKRKAHE